MRFTVTPFNSQTVATTQIEYGKVLPLLELHNVISKPKSMRVMKYAVMLVANLAAHDANRAAIVGDGKSLLISGLALCIQSPNKEIQNIAMRCFANLVQEVDLRSKLLETTSPLSPDFRLPQIFASQIQVAGGPVNTAFLLAYTLANFLKNHTAANQFVQHKGLDCLLDLLDTRTANVCGSTADAVEALCSTVAGGSGQVFRQEVLSRLQPAECPPGDEEWFIWMINEVFITAFGAGTVCASGFLPLIIRALIPTKGITCKYALLVCRKLAEKALDGGTNARRPASCQKDFLQICLRLR